MEAIIVHSFPKRFELEHLLNQKNSVDLEVQQSFEIHFLLKGFDHLSSLFY